MGETRRTRRAIERALEELAWARPIERMSSTTIPAEHEIGVAAAERAYAPSPAPSPRFDKVERVAPPMPVMPAAAPLGVPEPRPKRSPRRSASAQGGNRGSSRVQRPPLEPSPSAHPQLRLIRHRRRSAAHDAAKEPEELQPARSFSVGDTSFVVFTDGTIEARTPKGARRFDSMEEVRSYLEESAAS